MYNYYSTYIQCTDRFLNMLTPRLLSICVLLYVTAETVKATKVRLVGGSSDGTGRVEVYYKDQWNTLYGYTFKDNDAKVVCRMLGFNNSGIAYKFPGGASLFGEGTGLVITQSFNCRGNETDLVQCGTSTAWATSTTSHTSDVSVSCEPTPLRLADGDTNQSGRVEVFIKGTWSTICSSGFDNHDARGVCNILGYSDTGIAQAFTNSHFGQGLGESVLQSLNCKGTESDIKQCDGSWGINSCNHRSDAGVNCGSTSIRLVNGPSNSSGRVEILHGGSWGTICSGSGGMYDHYNVMVICKMLGFDNTNAFGYGNSYYGEGAGHVITSGLRCDGSEKDIANCPTNTWYHPTSSELCTHQYDVGVNCLGETPIRLVDGVSEQSGRLEIFHNGHWGTVQGNNFDNHALGVVCKMLGYEHSPNAYIMTTPHFGQGIGEVVLSRVRCNGAESDIGQCVGTWWPNTLRETHDHDVGISCDGVIPIRVVDGPTNASGRVEVLHNGLYGTVCDSGFDRYDLIVVCRMLGYENIPSTAYWHVASYFGQGLGEIVVSDLKCNGIENNIGQCGGTWPATTYRCSHDTDVSVSCDGATEKLRLAGGKDSNSGRVEVFHSGEWGTVCDTYFDRPDAVVICRLLGFQHPENAVAYTRDHFGKGNSTLIVATELHCNGLESTLEQCKPTWLPTRCSYTAGVNCCPSCQGSPEIVG